MNWPWQPAHTSTDHDRTPPDHRPAGDKIGCNACPVLCQFSRGKAGACDRCAHAKGVLVRADPVVLLRKTLAKPEYGAAALRHRRPKYPMLSVIQTASIMDSDSDDARLPEPVAAVLKVFANLQARSERNETGINALSVHLVMLKAKVCRFLQTMKTMKTMGCVRQEVDSERYGPSMRVFKMGTKALQYPDRIETTRSHVQQLCQATRQTLHLGMLMDSEIICVHKLDGRHRLDMVSKVDRLNQGVAGMGVSFATLPDNPAREPELVACAKPTQTSRGNRAARCFGWAHRHHRFGVRFSARCP